MADSVPAPGHRAGVADPAGKGDAPAGRSAGAGVAGVVLAAGEGARLRPLTDVLPKALCPVANRALVDLAIDAVRSAVTDVAVNVHHRRDLLEPHLLARGAIHVSVEDPIALGTAGALAHLRPWLAGRPALVVNADAWCRPDLGAFVDGWDGERVRILVAGDAPFGPRSKIVASILPWSEVARLDEVPSGLWESCWRSLQRAGAIDTAAYAGPFVDCGTPARYLAANRWASALASGTAAASGVEAEPPGADDVIAAAGAGSIVHPSAVVAPGAVVEGSVVGPGARIEGIVRRSVIWAGTTVLRSEVLDHAIRADRRVTVLVR